MSTMEGDLASMYDVFEWDGWQGQYRRAQRWFDRFLVVANDWDSHGLDEQIDYALVFFQNIYHLRDYLQKEEAVTQKSLDDLMSKTNALQVARDLANGSKHRFLTKPSVDASPWIIRTLGFDGKPRLTLKAGADLSDLVSVAGACVRAWAAFFRSEGLDPTSVSPAKQALVDALCDAHGAQGAEGPRNGGNS